jgi:WD40 repeat protein
VDRSLPPSTHCSLRPYDPKSADYEGWISAYKSKKGPLKLTKEDLRPLAGNLNREPIELAITVIEGDDLQPDDRFMFCGMRTTMSVYERGTVSWQRVTSGAVQGGGPSWLAAEDLQVMRSLIAELRERLPDDHSILPPPGRRLVLQVWKKNGGPMAGVYDRANLPDSVLEILGLAGAAIGPMTMNFSPVAMGTKEELGDQVVPADTIGMRKTHPRDPVTHALRADTVTLAISRDHSLVVERYLPFDGRLEVTDTKKSTVVLETSDYIVDQRWICFSHAWFSPDGRFLLLLSNLPAIYVYDTATWQQAKSLPGLPSDAVAYYPSSDWKHGVAVSRDGETSLWDAVFDRKGNALDLDGKLIGVAFSPDDSLVAVTSAHEFTEHPSTNQESSHRPLRNGLSTFHLRLWETKSGQFVREMRSLYYFAHNGMGDPMWWDQGKYVLTETAEGQFGSSIFGIWNVESGKFRGGLSGCAIRNEPSFPFALSGERLFSWCRRNKLLVWDVAGAINKIAEFESSLP